MLWVCPRLSWSFGWLTVGSVLPTSSYYVPYSLVTGCLVRQYFALFYASCFYGWLAARGAPDNPEVVLCKCLTTQCCANHMGTLFWISQDLSNRGTKTSASCVAISKFPLHSVNLSNCGAPSCASQAYRCGFRSPSPTTTKLHFAAESPFR